MVENPRSRSESDIPESLSLSIQLGLVVARLQRRVRVDRREAVPPLQLSVLATLDEHGPRPIGLLADREGVSAPTMTRAVAALARRGLVERDAATDRRCHIVRMSGAGARVLAEIRARETVFLVRRLDKLEAVQLTAIQAALPGLEALLMEEPTATAPR